MRLIAAALITLLILIPPLRAQEKPEDKAKDEKPKTPAEQLDAVKSELQKAPADVKKQLTEAKTDEERDQIRQDYIKRMYPKFATRLLELAEQNQKDEVGRKAAILLTNFSQVAARGGNPDVEKFLHKAAEKSSSREVQAGAYFALGAIVKNRADAALDKDPLQTAAVVKLDSEA